MLEGKLFGSVPGSENYRGGSSSYTRQEKQQRMFRMISKKGQNEQYQSGTKRCVTKSSLASDGHILARCCVLICICVLFISSDFIIWVFLYAAARQQRSKTDRRWQRAILDRVIRKWLSTRMR